MRDFTVAIVAKPCVPGRVKTRLHPDFTYGQAAELAEASLHQTTEVVREAAPTRQVLFFDGDQVPAWASDFELLRQPDGELDERLGYLFDVISEPLLLIGMDTPQVSVKQLRRVIGDLKHGAWLGLAPDGGFWALGMREPNGSLIRGVQMSQEDTGAQQLTRLRTSFGSDLVMLDELEDFDNRAALLRVAEAMPDSEFAQLAHRYAA